jgi:glycosyltransferase involved in cell wall biosynthesis
MNPYLTIIIATFNSEKTLGNALESIANQTYKDYEVIIIDNNSTDNTLGICNFYKKVFNNFKIISESDQGIYDAINKGIINSSGRWIYNLGSDDSLFSLTILDDVTKILKLTTKRFVYGSIKVLDRTEFFKKNEIYCGEITLTRLKSHGISQQATFYKKDIFSDLGLFNTRYKIWADWEFALKAFKNNEQIYISFVIANFSIGGISTREKDLNFIEDKVTAKY